MLTINLHKYFNTHRFNRYTPGKPLHTGLPQNNMNTCEKNNTQKKPLVYPCPLAVKVST